MSNDAVGIIPNKPPLENYMGINDLQIYQLAMELGEKVWTLVDRWHYFAKDTLGKQVVRSADSVAANISEGFGRYHFKENIHHGYIARGSLLETRTWLDKARRRQLISAEVYQAFDTDIDVLGKKLNAYLKTIGNQQGRTGYNASEPLIQYGSEANEPDVAWDDPTNNLPLSNNQLQRSPITGAPAANDRSVGRQ